MQIAFLQDVQELRSAIDSYVNPFVEEGSDLLILNTYKITDRSLVHSLYGIEKLDASK